MISVCPPAYAVIVAGGSGSRVGSALPKQFLELRGKPILYYSILAFIDALPGVHIVLVLPEGHMGRAQDALQGIKGAASVRTVAGGATRYASVAAGLKEVPSEAIVLVHDGARPLVTPELILRCYEGARIHGSAIPVVPVADSIRQLTAEGSRIIDRDDLRSVQTPQAFRAGLLQAAFRQPYQPAFTDEASVVESMGGAIHLVEGARSNLKITTPEDLVIAEALLARC